MKSTRHAVLYAADGRFWDYTFISIYSLLVNNRDLAFDIWVLSEASNDRFFSNVPFLKNLHGDVNIEWLPVSPGMFKDAPATDKITMATYYRLLMDSLLPESVDRLLYIDGDTIVRGSIQPFIDLDIDDVVLAAVPEYIPIERQPPMVAHPTRLGLPEGSQCFNAGVLYINLSMWRSLDIGQQGIRYVLDNLGNPEKLEFRDQDALNMATAGIWRAIGPYFNYHEWALDPQRDEDRHTVVAAGSNIPKNGPLVAHYTGPVKPWHGGSGHPYASDYWHYRMQTPYADRRELKKSKINGIPVVARRTFVRLLKTVPGGHSMLRAARARGRAA